MVANSVSQTDDNVEIKKMVKKHEGIEERVGLPPETLNTLQKVTDSKNNDGPFLQHYCKTIR